MKKKWFSAFATLGFALAGFSCFLSFNKPINRVSATAGTDTLTSTNTGLKTGTGGTSGYAGKVYSSPSTNATYVVYGNTAPAQATIQLRMSDSKSGLLTTVSAGVVSSLSFVFNSTTASDRAIDIYGSNTPYSGNATTGAAALYVPGTQGTKVGTVTYATGTTSYTFNSFPVSYQYFGFLSTSSSLYLDSVSVTWAAAATVSVSSVSIDKANASLIGAGDNVQLSAIAYGSDGLTIASDQSGSWTSSSDAVASVSSSGLVTAVAPGEATITFTSNDTTNGTITGTSTISVTAGVVYSLVKDVSSLLIGDKVIIASVADPKAISTDQQATYRGVALVSKNGENVEATGKVQSFEIQPGISSGTYSLYTGTGYLAAQSSASNTLLTNSSLDVYSSFSISISSSDNSATITTTGTVAATGGTTIYYNQSSTRFSLYKVDSTMTNKAVAIYKVGRSSDVGWSSDFYTTLEGTCLPSGGTLISNVQSVWTTFSGSYDALASDQKSSISSTSPNVNGSMVQRLLAKYSYIVSKYGSSQLPNFIGVSGLGAKPTSGYIVDEGLSSQMSLIVFCGMGTLSILGIFLLKKKRLA